MAAKRSRLAITGFAGQSTLNILVRVFGTRAGSLAIQTLLGQLDFAKNGELTHRETAMNEKMFAANDHYHADVYGCACCGWRGDFTDGGCQKCGAMIGLVLQEDRPNDKSALKRTQQ